MVCSQTVAVATGLGTGGWSSLLLLSTPDSCTHPTSGGHEPVVTSALGVPAPILGARTHAHTQTLFSSSSRSTASEFHFKSEPCIVSFSRLTSLRSLPCACLPQCTPTLPLHLILPELRNQPKREKYFCTLCNKIFMDHKGFFMCLPLIIKETLFSLSGKFNV